MDNNSKKIYFASDFHLGAPNKELSSKREKKIIRWLDMIKQDAKEVYIVGDIFDFWFEYKQVVPKGFIRLLGKLSELVDSGISVFLFRGNHDMWMYDYLPKEIGVKICEEVVETTFFKKKFYISHGDGLGPGDRKYKLLKQIFSSKFCQFLFSWIHPDIGISLANFLSKKSRLNTGSSDSKFFGEDKERLIIYSKLLAETKEIDYFVYGHRHYPLELEINKYSKYINLGDWITHNTYLEVSEDQVVLKKFE